MHHRQSVFSYKKRILETYEEYLLSEESNKKSSKLYGVLFQVVSNLTVTDKKVANYQLFQPFDILKKVKSQSGGDKH